MNDITRNNRKYTLLLFIVSVIWGTGFIATRIAIDASFSLAFIMLVRFGVGAAVFGAVSIRDIAKMRKADLLPGFICGSLLFVSFFLQTMGLKYTTPSNNAFITAANIILVPFLCWGLFRKRPPIIVFVGAGVCFLGVWVLSWQPGSGAMSLGKGDLLTLLSAVTFALHTVTLGHFVGKCNSNRLNFLQLGTSAVWSAALFFLTDRDFSQFRPGLRHLSVLYLTLFSTCFAYFIQTTAQKHIPPSRVAVIIATESLFASLLSVALGYEMLKGSLVLGGLLVLTSVLLVQTDFSLLFQGRNKCETPEEE